MVFRTPEDVWSEPINMGERINAAEGAEWSPYVSPDGKYLFFMTSRATIQNRFSPIRQTYDSLQDLHNQPMKRQLRYLVDRRPDHRRAPTRRILTAWPSAFSSPAPPRPRR